MSDATKVRIYVKLDTDWMQKQEDLPKPPIERLIEEFASSDPQIRLIGRDEISCTFEAVYGLDRRKKLEELLISALQNGLDIEPDETYAQWEIKELDDEIACEMPNIPKASWLVDVELDSDWVLAHRNDDPLPIENLLVKLGKVFVYMTIKRETLTGCSLMIAAEEKAEINIPLNIFLEDMDATEAVVSKVIYEVDKEELGAPFVLLQQLYLSIMYGVYFIAFAPILMVLIALACLMMMFGSVLGTMMSPNIAVTSYFGANGEFLFSQRD